MLSEHNCQGWLEGYVLTGRHGLFPSYEAFVEIVTSMANQLAKFLKVARELPWRPPVSSFNYLLTSEGWRQEHNGYSHQGPGFINAMLNKKASVSRVYLPPDANTLLAVLERCLTSTNSINLVVASKQPLHQWLTIDEARRHCAAGASAWTWAGTAGAEEPDVVFASSGAIPTIETLAAMKLLHADLPEIKTRYVNVVDLLSLPQPEDHPHGLSSEEFEQLFTCAARSCSSSTATRPRSTSSCTTGPNAGPVPRRRLHRGGDDRAAVPAPDRQRRQPLPPRDQGAAAHDRVRERRRPPRRGVHATDPPRHRVHPRARHRSARDHGVDVVRRARQ